MENIDSITKDVVKDIVGPTSKSIGKNLGLLVDGVIGWLGYWGEKQAVKRKVYLDDYKEKISNKIAAIPEDKLVEPKIRVVGPAIEASKYFIEENKCREMFSELIASSCNSEIQSSVHPAFPSIITQLSSDDATFMTYLREMHTVPCVELYEKDKNEKITPYNSMLFDFKGREQLCSLGDELKWTESVNNLTRLGLLSKNSEILELDYNYNNFRNHWLYQQILSNVSTDSTLYMKQYRIELTVLGRSFIKCCI